MMPFAIDVTVVDGAGGIVVVIDVADDVEGVAVLRGESDVLVDAPLSVAGLEPEHAPPNVTKAATSATTRRRSVSGHSRV